MSEPILQLINLKKEFEMNKKETLKAVNDVNLEIYKGERIAVVGESGCGKSTLAKLVARIQDATDGKILFNGNDITKIRKNELKQYRRKVQMIFQHPTNVFSPRMKIGTFLMEPWINFEKKSKQDAKEAAYEALRKVKLNEEYFQKYPHQLSGGELQRVSIARAIALEPELLICDEATSALDVSIQKEIIDLLNEHQRKTDFAIMFICHDLALVENFCEKVVVMYLGKIVEIMDARALKKNALHPYTKALLDSVFRIHENLDVPIKILPGEPPSPVNLPNGCVFCDRCVHATELCKKETPKLTECKDGHYVACFKTNKEK